MEEEDEFSALLDGVYARRRVELLERAQALVTAVDGWSTGEPGRADAATTEAHRLAGGLGTLGFAGLSETARALERRAASGAPAGADERRAAAALLRSLQEAVTRPVRGR